MMVTAEMIKAQIREMMDEYKRVGGHFKIDRGVVLQRLLLWIEEREGERRAEGSGVRR